MRVAFADTYADARVCQMKNVGPQVKESAIGDQDLSYEKKRWVVFGVAESTKD